MRPDDKKNDEKPSCSATVVGGQPEKESKRYREPTGLEALLLIASQNEEEKTSFLNNPFDFAKKYGITLSETEKEMLFFADQKKLAQMVRSVEKSPLSRRVVLKNIGCAGLSVLLFGGVVCTIAIPSLGSTIDIDDTPKFKIQKIKAPSPKIQKEMMQAFHDKEANCRRMGFSIIRFSNKPFVLTVDFYIEENTPKIDRLFSKFFANRSDEQKQWKIERIEHSFQRQFEAIQFPELPPEENKYQVVIVYYP